MLSHYPDPRMINASYADQGHYNFLEISIFLDY